MPRKDRKDEQDEAPKSAFELAMERLQAQDEEEGREAPRTLSSEEKEAIAALKARFEAKIAERKILHVGELRKAAEKGDPEALAKLQEDQAAELASLARERDEEIETIRRG
jgi:hypothetical protein